MKNLQDNPSIAIIVPFNGDVEMYHPKPVYDVCFSNCRTYSRLKILPLFTFLQNCC